MKNCLASIAIVLLASPALAQDGGKIKWSSGRPDQDFARAAREAKRDTMVYFRARWAANCAKLDESAFSDDEVIRLAEGWQRFMVDLNDEDAFKLARSRQRIAGLPTVRFYSKEGDLIDEVVAGTDPEPIVRKLKGEGRSVRGRAIQVDRANWVDTHRVFLRNGNIIDGQLEELTEDVAVVQWDAQSRTTIKRQDIVRIEWITIRRVDEEAPKVELPKPEVPPTPDVEPKKEMEKPVVAGDVQTLVQKILAEIGSGQPADAVAEELSRTGTEGLVYAASLVDSLSPDSALAVVSAVTLAHEKKAAPILRTRLPALTDNEVLCRTINALAALDDDKASGPIAELVGHPSIAVRSTAIDCLGRIGDRTAIAALSGAVVDPDSAVRGTADAALTALAGRLDAKDEAVSVLLTATSRVPEARRTQAPLVLGKLATESAVTALIGFLRSTELEVRTNAVAALSALPPKDAAAAEQLRDMLPGETDAALLAKICAALGKMNDLQAVPNLIDVLANASEDDLKKAAAQALEQISKQQFGQDVEKWKSWWVAQPH